MKPEVGIRICLMAGATWPLISFAQAIPADQGTLVHKNATETAALPPTAALKVPRFAAAYEGKWEIKRPDMGYRTISNTNTLTVVSQTEIEATGQFTSNQTSMGVCSFRDAPMVLRSLTADSVSLVATHRDPSCGARQFKLKRESSGRLSWQSNDGLQTMYLDPKE